MVARGLLGSGCRTTEFRGKGKDAGSFRLKMFDTPRAIKAIESVFGAAEWNLAKGHVAKRATSVQEWCKRFEKVLKEFEADGSIERTARSFRRRMQKIIDAQGAPTEK